MINQSILKQLVSTYKAFMSVGGTGTPYKKMT